ncbi:MAG: hypothetical protein QOH12_521, partial [Solirubrobacteraceae bacterium]|nr:hypothetical protein [Solirubrobacteraceae bacterium]
MDVQEREAAGACLMAGMTLSGHRNAAVQVGVLAAVIALLLGTTSGRTARPAAGAR